MLKYIDARGHGFLRSVTLGASGQFGVISGTAQAERHSVRRKSAENDRQLGFFLPLPQDETGRWNTSAGFKYDGRDRRILLINASVFRGNRIYRMMKRSLRRVNKAIKKGESLPTGLGCRGMKRPFGCGRGEARRFRGERHSGRFIVEYGKVVMKINCTRSSAWVKSGRRHRFDDFSRNVLEKIGHCGLSMRQLIANYPGRSR